MNNPKVFPGSQLKNGHSWLWHALALLLILLGLGVRLVDLNDPPLDFHPTRQLRSAIIARGMYYASMPDADAALRDKAIQFWASMELYEPPIFERLVALTYRVIGSEQLWVARVYSSLAWAIGGAALYVLLRRMFTPGAAIFSLGFYLLLPWGVLASRAFQPDPAMVMWVLLSAYTLYRWGEARARSWLWAVLAGVSCGMAVLIKAFALFFVVAMALGILVSLIVEEGKFIAGLRRVLARPQAWALAGLAAAIPAVYYLGLGPRSGEFASFWIISLSRLLLDREFYMQWLALIRGLMDVAVFFTALLAVFLIPGRGRLLVLGLWAGYFLLGLTFPFQIYTHDYYSLALVPVVAISLAPLADLVLKRLDESPRLWKALFILVFLVISGYYTWVSRSQFYGRDYRLEPVPWKQMGADLPNDGDIIALTHDYGNRLKYYGWRMVNRMWPGSGDLSLSEAAGSDRIGNFEAYFQDQTAGMEYFLVTLFGDLNAQPELKSELYDHYDIYAQGDGYVLFDLRQRK